VTGRWRRRRTQLPDYLKERRGYCKLIEEELHLTVWTAYFGRGYGPFVRQTADWLIDWLVDWLIDWLVEWMNEYSVYINDRVLFCFQSNSFVMFTFLTVMLLKIEGVLYWVSSSWFVEGSLIPSSSEWISATIDGLKTRSAAIFSHCSTLKNNSLQAFNLRQVTQGHIPEDLNLQPKYIVSTRIYCFAILKSEY